MSVPERILAQLIPCPITGCLLWWGAVDAKGYGVCWYKGKRRRVNRVLFKCRRGRWPRRDREVLHSCDTPQCGEDRHHTEGTRRQNARDRHAKGRTRGCIRRAA